MIFSTKFKITPMKIETMTLFVVFSQSLVFVLPSTWWFFMVGKNEISIASHQKKIVAGTSRDLPKSLHFLLLLVNILEIIPIG